MNSETALIVYCVAAGFLLGPLAEWLILRRR